MKKKYKIEGNLKEFAKDIQQQMEKMNEINEISEKIAGEITNINSVAILKELMPQNDISKKEMILESFFRGAWTTLFVMANNHEKGFLENEFKGIKDFHDKMYKRENKSKSL